MANKRPRAITSLLASGPLNKGGVSSSTGLCFWPKGIIKL